jgi:hypothetical protein
MGEVKYNTSHHAGGTPEARIASRLRNSGCDTADHIIQKGSGPTRTFTNVHAKGQGGSAQRVDVEKGGIKSGPGNPGEGSIVGTRRTTV